MLRYAGGASNDGRTIRHDRSYDDVDVTPAALGVRLPMTPEEAGSA
jgi:hypothetical protein